jgi:hypothetical protein
MKRRGNVISPIDTINTLQEMLVGTDFTVEDGELVYVRLTQQWFVYRVNSGLVVDGINVIAPAYGNGVWELLNIGPGGANAGLGPFNTVAKGLAGSGRLLDVTAGQIALLKRGNVAWVESVKDFWRWDPASTLTADNITICNPTANGVNPGRFIRELIPAPEWMLQPTWIMDGSNSSTTASDENDGLTAATPLLTDLERQRRMGPAPVWTQLEYHLRYISDITYVQLNGVLDNSTVFLHGSMTDGQGQSTLYSGTIDALVAQNPATNTPYQITSNGIPVSWTASSLIETGPTNARVRVTSNTVGATGFAVFDQGAKQARWTEVMAAVTFTAPYVNNFTSPALVNGSTFVVEKLTDIKYFHMGLFGRGISGTGAVGTVVAESLRFGASGATNGLDLHQSGVSFITSGCILISPIGTFGSGPGNITARSTWFCATTVGGSIFPPTFGAFVYAGGGTDAVCNFHGPSAVNVGTAQVRNNFMVQNGAFRIESGNVTFLSLAVFDPAAGFQVGVQVDGPQSSANFLVNAPHWGGGTVRAPVYAWFMSNNATVYYVNLTGETLVGSIVDIQFGAQGPQSPAFDVATSTYTALRTRSFVNLAATVAAGGFGGSIKDPVGGAYVGPL